jgi:HK97 family phage prohead protease
VADRTQRAKPGDKRGIEYRAMDARADGDAGTVAGYLSTFWVVDSYGTAVHPNAFDETLKRRGDKLPLLYQHNPDWAIGKLANLETDETGLRHESAVVDDGAEGTVALKRLRAGVPFAHSFGFRTLRERQATDADPLILGADMPKWISNNLPGSVWVIEEVKLYEGSIVTFPANEQAIITEVRAQEEAQALALVLEDLRAGRLDAAGRALVAEIAAAWRSAAPDGGDPAPRTDDAARRDREFALSLWAGSVGLDPAELGVGASCAA